MDKKGFTLVEIIIVVLIVGLLAVIAIPNFIRGRTKAQKNACIANLKQIDAVKQVWVIDTNKTGSSVALMSDLVPTYIKNTPSCPCKGHYTIGSVSDEASCDIAGHSQ